MDMMNTILEKNIMDGFLSESLEACKKNPSLGEQRQRAWDAFIQLGLPERKNEEYRYFPISAPLKKSNATLLSSNDSTNNILGDDTLLKNIFGNHLIFVDGKYDAERSSLVSPGEQIQITPLEDALVKFPEKIAEHFNTGPDWERDPFVAWNTASWTSGVLVEVPDLQAPLHPVIFHFIQSPGKESITLPRLLMLVGKSSHLKVMATTSTGNHFAFTNRVIETKIAENGQCDFFWIQNDLGNIHEVNTIHLEQKANSRCHFHTLSLGGKMIRNNLQVALNGEGCETHLFGLYVLNGNSLVDHHTVVDHKKPNSFSNELYKGIMDGHSKGIFNGKIFVRPHAQKTNAFQSNRNLLLTDNASIHTKPQLEIWADDVKCSHGCTSGQLDDEALFYLRSRGIGMENAKAMLLYAFAEEVLEKLNFPEVKQLATDLISARLHKSFVYEK